LTSNLIELWSFYKNKYSGFSRRIGKISGEIRKLSGDVRKEFPGYDRESIISWYS
jgi:hypothetical protein